MGEKSVKRPVSAASSDRIPLGKYAREVFQRIGKSWMGYFFWSLGLGGFNEGQNKTDEYSFQMRVF